MRRTSRAGSRAAARRRQPRRHSGRPRRDRQEPARHRGRACHGGPVSRRYLLRALEGVLEAGLLLPTIAYVLGVRDNGEAALEERIARALDGPAGADRAGQLRADRDAAPVLVRLYTAAPLARFLVTSRIVLRIRGEQVYEVEALPSPEGTGPPSLDRALRSSAVTLFVDRAQAVKPGFTITSENAAAIADICRSSRVCPWRSNWPPLKVRAADTPGYIAAAPGSQPAAADRRRARHAQRHRTMRATIDWSVSLLPDEQRGLLEDLGVFATRFTLEAVEAIGRGRSVGRAGHRCAGRTG